MIQIALPACAEYDIYRSGLHTLRSETMLTSLKFLILTAFCAVAGLSLEQRSLAAQAPNQLPQQCPYGALDFLDHCHLTSIGRDYFDNKMNTALNRALAKADQLSQQVSDGSAHLPGGVLSRMSNAEAINCWKRYKIQQWADNPAQGAPDLSIPNPMEFPDCAGDYGIAQKVRAVLRTEMRMLLLADGQLSAAADPIGYLCGTALGKLAVVLGRAAPIAEGQIWGERVALTNKFYRTGKDWYETVYPDKEPNTQWGKIAKLCFKY